jgi:hypothetical protein
MKHVIQPLATEEPQQRKHRAEFEAFMASAYPGFDLAVHPSTGYYADPAVNCCWEIWLHLSGSRDNSKGKHGTR